MRKRSWLTGAVFLLIAVMLPSCAAGGGQGGSAKNDFRNADWGMSRTRVEQSESVAYTYASDELMLFEVEEHGDTIQVYYEFADDKLISGQCRIQMEDQLTGTLMQDMIDSYVAFRERLTDLYGPPLEEDYRVWLNYDAAYANDTDIYNIYYKRLGYVTEWDLADTSVRLTFDYDKSLVNYVLTAAQKTQDG